jgi:hypothetical protein
MGYKHTISASADVVVSRRATEKLAVSWGALGGATLEFYGRHAGMASISSTFDVALDVPLITSASLNQNGRAMNTVVLDAVYDLVFVRVTNWDTPFDLWVSRLEG